MADVVAAIEAQLKDFCGDSCADFGKTVVFGILDLHKPDGIKWPDCVECSCDVALAGGECHQTVRWPCPTVQAVAEGLGIKMEDGDE